MSSATFIMRDGQPSQTGDCAMLSGRVCQEFDTTSDGNWYKGTTGVDKVE